MKSHLFVIVGPSGVGKSTIVSEIRNICPDLFYSISCTTRLPRTGEENGIHFWFLTRMVFQEWIGADKFLEWKKVYGHLYGTLMDPISKGVDEGRNYILDIDLEGYKEINKKMPEAIGIFILPPSLDELYTRLIERGTDDEDVIRLRLSLAGQEINEGRTSFAYQVLNDNLQFAVAQTVNIIRKESHS